MTDGNPASLAPLRLSLDWLEDGSFLVRAHFYRVGRTRPDYSRRASFQGLDAALGWMERQAFSHGLETGRDLTYASVLDPASEPGRSQGRLWP